MKTNVFLICGLALCLSSSGAFAQTGTVPNGGVCTSESDCYSYICSSGKCVACQSDFDCGAIEYCNLETKACENANRPLGATCTNSRQCLDDNWCDPVALKCVKPLPLFANCIADGSVQTPLYACGDNAYCKPYNQNAPNDGFCAPARGFGASCNGVQTCEPQYVCPVELADPTCTLVFPRGDNNFQCNTDLQCGWADYCTTNLFGPGPCQARKTAGNLCVRNRECQSNVCGLNGVCTAATSCANSPSGLNPCPKGQTCLASGVCSLPLPIGDPCTSASECAAPSICSPATANATLPKLTYCQQCTSSTPPNGVGECADPGVSPSPSGVFCAADQPIKTCESRIAFNQPCTADFQCASFKCDPNTRLCLAVPDGTFCGSTKACNFTSFCPSNPLGTNYIRTPAEIILGIEPDFKANPSGLPIMPKQCTPLLPIGGQCLANDQCFNQAAPNAPQNIMCDTTNPIAPVCTYKCDGVPGIIPALYTCPAGYFCPDPTVANINEIRPCRLPYPDTIACTQDNQCLSGRCAIINLAGGTCLPKDSKLPNGYLCASDTACLSGRCLVLPNFGPLGTCVDVPKLPANAPCTNNTQCFSLQCTNNKCSDSIFSTYRLDGGAACYNSTQCASGQCTFTACGGFSCPIGICTAVPAKLPNGAECSNSIDCGSGVCRYIVTFKTGRCVPAFGVDDPFPGLLLPPSPRPPPPPGGAPAPVIFVGKRIQNKVPNVPSPRPNYGRKLSESAPEQSAPEQEAAENL